MLHDVRADGSTAARPGRRRVLTKSLPQHNRVHNRSLILQALFTEGAMSRADLARESGLTRPTVSGIVSDLESEALVTEIGPREDTRVGKPATLIAVDVDAFHIVVADLSGTDRFVGAVLNLRGDVVQRAAIDIDGAVGEEAVGRVVRLLERLASMTQRRLLGIGVGCPGVVDDHGVVQEAILRAWSGLDLQGRLTAHFHVPVHVVNDANLAAVGLHTFGDGPGTSLMIITIENGVGAGLILGGEPVLGEQFSAGEIGHVTVDDDGEVCPCGRRGCLEVLIGARHLRARLAATDDAGRDAVLRHAGASLGGVIAPIISAVNLTEVVLAGPSELLDGAFADAVLATARARTLSRVGAELRVTVVPPDADPVLLGGASTVLAAELGVT